jgi:hypothetical protein
MNIEILIEMQGELNKHSNEKIYIKKCNDILE